ncbi:MAG: chromosome segregation protein ScpA [Methanomassiliicoccaceae archaeon]|nr:chromosome segregation protein ScpA [Methanomassiliicoccaceae archaeon]
MGTEMGTDGMERMEGMEQHLLFHKALIDDSVGSEKIDRYISVLKESGPGETMSDPVDESIRSAFSLVLEHEMDPWCIDIVEFARMYSVKKVKNAVDIMVAGKLIHMAWKILRMQSDVTLEEGERFDPFGDDGWDMGFDMDMMFEPEKLYVPDVEFREAVRRTSVRPVTMFELLDAFEDAREEMELHLIREQARLELKDKEPRKFENKAHDEDDERDVDRVWSIIENLGTGPLPIRDLYVNDIRANITTFVSVLHLVAKGKLAIWQDNMPYGEIFVEIKMDWMSGVVEDSSAEELVKRAVV